MASWDVEDDQFIAESGLRGLPRLASADCPDAWGYEDRAIGHFSTDTSAIEGSHRVLTEFWAMQGEWDWPPWEDFWGGAGLVDHATAEAWRDEVWEPGRDWF